MRILNRVIIILVITTVFCFAGCKDFNPKQTETLRSAYVSALGNGSDLTYEEWLELIKGEKGDKGEDAKTPVITINEEGIWCIDGVPTDTRPNSKGIPNVTIETVLVEGQEEKHWFIEGVDTGVLAEGLKGDSGDPGKDGATLEIVDGVLYVDNEPAVDEDGNPLVVEGKQGEKGEAAYTFYTVTLSYLEEEFGYKDRFEKKEDVENDLLTFDENGNLISFRIKSSKWITDELPQIKEEYKDSFMGWFIQLTDIQRGQYDFVGGDITLIPRFTTETP